MYDYAMMVLRREAEKLQKEQQDMSDKIRCKIVGSEHGLLNINTMQSWIFDIEDAIGILEDISKDVEKEKRE